MRKKGTYEKGFKPNWTEEVFTITTVKATKPPTYTIEDTPGEPSSQEGKRPNVCQVERLQQCIQFVATTS